MIINHLSREVGARRLSIREVASRAGISYGAVSELYHGRAKRVDLETLNRLCRALDASVGDLLEYAPDPTDTRAQ